MLRTTLVASAALSLMTFSSALGADMAVKAPVYKAPPAFSWTRCYVGATGGYTTSKDTPTRIRPGDPDLALSQTLGNVPTSLDPDGDGYLIGGQAGCDQQYSNRIVLGIVTDLSHVDAPREASVVQGFANVTTRFKQDLEIFGTLRARAGIAIDQMLLYATGGLAYGKTKASAGGFPGPGIVGPALDGSQSNWQWGWTVGAGAEWALNQTWSFGVEYLYYDLGSDTLTAPTVNGVPPLETAFFDYDTKGHIVRAALNYRF
jgi:outer membrane immunogenic protein